MARTLHADLTTAQQASTGTPYVRIWLPDYSGGTDLSSYLISLDHIEQTFGGSATLIFTDADSWFISSHIPIDLRGERVDIGYGYNCAGDVDRYSEAAPLWIRNTRLISAEGQVLVQFDCFDIWQRLQMCRVMGDSAGAAPGWEKSTTIYDIIASLISGITTLTKDSSDGVIDVFKPYYLTEVNDPIAGIINDMMAMTKCGIRMRQDGLHVFKLPETDTGAYAYDGTHTHFSNISDDELTWPNRVIVVDQYPTTAVLHTYEGAAIDSVSYAKLGFYVTRIYEAPGVESNDEANDIAETILSAIQREVSLGVFIAPMNCGAELFDFVKVVDKRW